MSGMKVVPANVKSSWQSCLVQSRKSHKQEKVNQNILGISDESLRSTGSHVGCASPGPPPPPPGLQCAGFCFVGLHLLQETIVHCAGLKSPVMPPKCFLFILSLDMKEGASVCQRPIPRISLCWPSSWWCSDTFTPQKRTSRDTLWRVELLWAVCPTLCCSDTEVVILSDWW